MMNSGTPLKLIYICHGNICRSPMAEFITKNIVLRAGIAEKFAIRSAAVSYEGGADILVVMDHSNERLLKRIIDPEDFGKIHFMMDYAGRPGQDVADPWYSGDFERTYRELDAACRGLVEEYAQLNII